MKTKPLIILTLLALFAGNTVAAPLSTAFTYQGRLADAGNPAQGSYDLRFAIWDAAADGNIVVGPVTNSPVGVTNGLFTAMLDFGAGVFDGNSRWLEIAVRPNGTAAEFTLLSPRQPLTPAPYALYTPTAGTASTAAVATSVGAGAVGTAALQAGAVDSSRIAQGAVGPDQLADAAVTADKLDEGIGFWTRSGDDVFRPSGNVGIATTLPAARLEVKGNPRVDNDEPPQLRLTGGGAGGALSALDLATYDPGTNAPAARIQATDINYSAGVDILTKEPGADTNALVSRLHIAADGKVGIGTMNPEAALQVTGSPRVDNSEPAQLRLTGGAGEGAQSLLDLATYPPGTNAPAARIQATDINFSAGVDILTKEPGAIDNALVSRFHVAAGGNVGIGTTNPQTALQVVGTVTADNFSSSGGGPMVLGTTDAQSLEFRVNSVSGLRLEYPTVGSVPNLIGGYGGNAVGSGSEGVVIAGGGAVGYLNTIGTNADFNAIGGGSGNNIADYTWYGTIAGGGDNHIGIYADVSTIGGGGGNTIADNTLYATIAGGRDNDIGTNSSYSMIGGGYDNNIAENSGSATIAGGIFNDIGTNADESVIGGGVVNTIADNASSATIAGGGQNRIRIDADDSVIGGGAFNEVGIDAKYSVIGGGVYNANNSKQSTIAGGIYNSIATNSSSAAISGGFSNIIASGSYAPTIAGGVYNDVGTNSSYSVIGGGYDNNIATNSVCAVIAGGAYNDVGPGAPYAFAAGRRAKALHRGAFVWADPTGVDFASTATNQFLIRAQGGVGINTNTPVSALHVAGTVTADAFDGPISAGQLTGTIAPANIGDGTITSPKLDSTIGLWSRSGDNVFRQHGYVGIAVTNPTERLQAGTGISLHDGGHKVIAFGYSPNTGNATLSNSPAEVRFAPSEGSLRISTTPDSIAQGAQVTGMQERLRIDQHGRVGIGTNDPQAALHVAGSIMADSFSGSGAGLTAIDGGALANSSVTSAKILDGTIANNDLANNSVTSGKIADGSVWNSDLANNAVTSGKIADGTILNSDLANNSVTSGKIQDGQVSSADIADGTVSTSDLNLASVDARYVQAAGDTITGDLEVLGDVNLRDRRLTMYANASNAYPRVVINGDGEADLYVEGNVGIGKTNPAAKLGVSSSGAHYTGYPTLAVRDTSGRGTLLLESETDAPTDFVFRNNGTNRWWLSSRQSDSDYNLTVYAGNDAGAPSRATMTIERATGNVGIGTTSPGAKLDVNGRIITDELQINGGSDLSEQFDIETGAKPGSVVCIDPDNPGRLVVSSKAYDRTVAGIVSGAGGVKPGMMMGQDGTMADGDLPVALSGRVYCRVDAGQGGIRPGDLITTSDVPGCGMKVADYSRAHGAIIGKAMTGLDCGQGLILVLVSLH